MNHRSIFLNDFAREVGEVMMCASPISILSDPYIGKLYGIEKEMQEACLDPESVQKSRQEDTLQRIPTETKVENLLPCNWQQLGTTLNNLPLLPASFRK